MGDLFLRWDDEATKPWVHITVSRSIPIDIPDLASRISRYMASCLGLFRRVWEKTDPRATGFDMLACTSMRRWKGQGLRAGSAVRHVEQ